MRFSNLLKLFAILFLLLFIFTFYFFQKQPAVEKIQNKTIATSTPITNWKEITHGDESKKQVIFTFDGGASAESGNKILEVLKKHNVKGTFFLTGKFVEKYPDLTKKIISNGHEIFNHTYNHPYLTKLSDEQITEELNKMDDTLLLLGDSSFKSSKPYFRAPFGNRNTEVLSVASKAGYKSVYWTVDALDWKESTGETSEQVENRILSNLNFGTIYLMHVGDNITGSILDNIFTKIEEKGYKIVSLTQGI